MHASCETGSMPHLRPRWHREAVWCCVGRLLRRWAVVLWWCEAADHKLCEAVWWCGVWRQLRRLQHHGGVHGLRQCMW